MERFSPEEHDRQKAQEETETQQMAVAAVARLFDDFHPLEALRLVIRGTERSYFPEYIRPGLEAILTDMKQSYERKHEFVVHRVMDKIRAVLEPFLHAEAQRMLEGLRRNAQRIKEAGPTKYHAIEVFRDLEN